MAVYCLTLACSSCASTLYNRKGKVVIANDRVHEPVTIAVGDKFYENVTLPYKVKVQKGYKPVDVTVTSNSYEPYSFTIDKKFNKAYIGNIIFPIGFAIDAMTGAMMKPSQRYYYVDLKLRNPYGSNYGYDTPQGGFVNGYYQGYSENKGDNVQQAVSRDDAGAAELEGIIIRWYVDSDPRGARIYWRVISSIPEEVKNTNETYLMTTPYEETRAFNILGLTYENSKDVQIEIKVSKRGFEDQVKRFNVRQAIDQQEISTFFELIPKTGYNIQH